MPALAKWLISGSVFAIVTTATTINATPPGFLEGQLKIVSPKEVELADGSPSGKAEAVNYAEYPLIILSRDQKTQIEQLTADANGKYRIALPPGDYILDAQGRRRGHIRATPHPFTIVSNQTVRVDMDVDSGIR